MESSKAESEHVETTEKMTDSTPESSPTKSIMETTTTGESSPESPPMKKELNNDANTKPVRNKVKPLGAYDSKHHGGDGHPVIITQELGAGVTKADIREKVWNYMEDHNLVHFPRPIHHRIPNFKGANVAADKLSKLEEFKHASTVKVNPDKPQEDVRFRTLEAEKRLLVPIRSPRFRNGKIMQIHLPGSFRKRIIRDFVTHRGIREYSVPVAIDAPLKVDLIVLGSVAVSKSGIRIGKGEGFADLEYAMMRTYNAVSDDTIVVTTVHDCQVVDIPENLIMPHDVPVDFIVTPNHVYKCTQRDKPAGILWHELTLRKIERIPVLKQLYDKQNENGQITLMEEPEGESGGDGDGHANEKLKEDRPQRKRRSHPGRGGYRGFRGRPGRRNYYNSKSSYEFSLFVGMLPRELRVKDFKAQVRAQGVDPYKVSWFGRLGYSFLVFQTEEECNEALNKLKGFEITTEVKKGGEDEETMTTSHEVKVDWSKRTRKPDQENPDQEESDDKSGLDKSDPDSIGHQLKSSESEMTAEVEDMVAEKLRAMKEHSAIRQSVHQSEVI